MRMGNLASAVPFHLNVFLYLDLHCSKEGADKTQSHAPTY